MPEVAKQDGCSQAETANLNQLSTYAKKAVFAYGILPHRSHGAGSSNLDGRQDDNEREEEAQ